MLAILLQPPLQTASVLPAEQAVGMPCVSRESTNARPRPRSSAWRSSPGAIRAVLWMLMPSPARRLARRPCPTGTKRLQSNAVALATAPNQYMTQLAPVARLRQLTGQPRPAVPPDLRTATLPQVERRSASRASAPAVRPRRRPGRCFRNDRGRLRRCRPRSTRATPGGRWPCTISRVVDERSICPPWAAAQIRAPR